MAVVLTTTLLLHVLLLDWNEEGVVLETQKDAGRTRCGRFLVRQHAGFGSVRHWSRSSVSTAHRSQTVQPPYKPTELRGDEASERLLTGTRECNGVHLHHVAQQRALGPTQGVLNQHESSRDDERRMSDASIRKELNVARVEA